MSTPGAPHYLDHAATTPVRPAAAEAWIRAVRDTGNASSLHGSGRRARRELEESRESVAADLGCRPSEVVFTSGGTESDNLAVLGRARALGPGVTVAVGATEHHSVLDAAAHLGSSALARVEVVPVSAEGVPDADALAAVLDAAPGPSLVALMLANNETGAISPIAELSAVAGARGAGLHTDAVQAVGHIGVDVAALGATSLSLSGHKFGAPAGTGALVLDRATACEPLGFGGGQERDLRSGTVDVAGAVALAVALREAVGTLDAESERLAGLRDRLVEGVLGSVRGVELTGPATGGARLPGIADLVFPSCSGESLILLLDAAGVECSTGAACTAGVAEPSHVLLAMGRDEESARGSLRFSLGHTSTGADVDAVLSVLPGAVERARAAGTVVGGRARARAGAAR